NFSIRLPSGAFLSCSLAACLEVPPAPSSPSRPPWSFEPAAEPSTLCEFLSGGAATFLALPSPVDELLQPDKLVIVSIASIAQQPQTSQPKSFAIVAVLPAAASATLPAALRGFRRLQHAPIT